MSLLNKLRHVLAEPPPEYVFEFSEAGIAWAHHGKTETSGFEPLEPGVISVTAPKAFGCEVAIGATAASGGQLTG